MKSTFTLWIFLILPFSVFSQSILQRGNTCFDRGDYACAQIEYKNAMKTATGKDRQVAEIKLTQAKWCEDKLKAANEAFKNRSYTQAKIIYQNLFETNPNDEFAKSQLEECSRALTPVLTLSVSRESASFASSGGSEKISVNTNATSYSVDGLPAWCKVQKYSAHFIILCDPNFTVDQRKDYVTVSISNKAIKVNINQAGILRNSETTLSLTRENLSFPSTGGTSEQIKVKSNNANYSISLLPAWCSVQHFDHYFVISCTANNSSQARSDWFKVTAGEKDLRVYLNQSGTLPKPANSLTVSQTNLSFPASGGLKNQIKVYISAPTYTTSLIPEWCSVQKYEGYLFVSCNVNNNRARSSWFKVTAEGKEVIINVNQQGNYRSVNNAAPQRAGSIYKNNQNAVRQRCFNCPKSKNTLGLTAGYTQLQSDSGALLDGVRFGLRIEPLFKYGFALSTGIAYEGYSESLFSPTNPKVFDQYAINIPVHLEYRLNFSKWFTVFGYGGVAINCLVNSKSDELTLPTTYDYGGGFRISNIQLNIDRSYKFGDLRNMESIGENRKLFRNFVISLSYMF